MPLDSIKLKGDGSFSFKQLRPESPEFYRLRVEDKVINFSVDSTETVRFKHLIQISLLLIQWKDRRTLQKLKS